MQIDLVVLWRRTFSTTPPQASAVSGGVTDAYMFVETCLKVDRAPSQNRRPQPGLNAMHMRANGIVRTNLKTYVRAVRLK